jgi:hypothetical protein
MPLKNVRFDTSYQAFFIWHIGTISVFASKNNLINLEVNITIVLVLHDYI